MANRGNTCFVIFYPTLDFKVHEMVPLERVEQNILGKVEDFLTCQGMDSLFFLTSLSFNQFSVSVEKFRFAQIVFLEPSEQQEQTLVLSLTVADYDNIQQKHRL